jgi:ElaB/YqjD/DUF883 family membrane-anchored ribosome-binding protein
MTQDPGLAAAKAQLVDDFSKVVADAEALLRSIGSLGGDKAAAMRETVEAQLASAKGRLLELQGAATDRAADAVREADDYVHENPWTAIGVAALVGVMVGLALGSRR